MVLLAPICTRAGLPGSGGIVATRALLARDGGEEG